MKSTVSLDNYLRQSLINFHRIDNEVLCKTTRLRSPLYSQSDNNNDTSIDNNQLANSLNNCEIIKRKLIQIKKKNNSTLDLSITSKSYQYRLESARSKIKELNKNNFTFHPVIDKMSKRLAEYIEPRTKRKKGNNSFVSEFKYSPYSNRMNSSVDNNSTGAFYLYEKSKRSRERKQLKKEYEQKQKIKKEKEELSKMFKPTLYKRVNDKIITHHRLNNSVYIANKEKKNLQRELLSQFNEGKQCTFKPMLCISNLSNDETLIQSQVPYTNDYVNERRKNKSTSKANSNTINTTKRKYIATIPQSDKREKKLCRHANTPERVKEQRKIMGTSLFYE